MTSVDFEYEKSVADGKAVRRDRPPRRNKNKSYNRRQIDFLYAKGSCYRFHRGNIYGFVRRRFGTCKK